jgi:ABC-type multidrug transport system fused ATPase/permease subunit
MRFNSFEIIWTTFRKYRLHVALLGVLGLFSAVVEGIGINAVIPLLSFLVSNGKPTDFISTTLEKVFMFAHIPFLFRYLLGFILVMFMIRAVAVILFGYIRGRITADYLSGESQEMLRLSLFASWPFLLKQKLGHLQNTLVRDIQRTANLLEAVGQVLQSFTGFFMYLAIAVNISPVTTLSTLVAGAVLLLLVRPLIKRLQQTGGAMVATEKNISQFLGEHIIGMKAIKAAGVEEKAYVYSQNLFKYMRDLYVKMMAIRSLSTSFFQPFAIVFVLVLFSITYKSGTFNLISFAATLYLIQKIFTYLESGQNSLNAIGELVPYAQNVKEFKQLLAENAETTNTATKPFIFKDSLEFKSVELAYHERAQVLRGMNFTVMRGQTVALVGPSGAGKTSVADLTLRLFRPTGGAVLLDGVNIEDISITEWRTNLGYVAQDVFLLNGSIEDNIRFYNEDLTHDEIVKASKQASIYDFIQTLPEGFATMVGDRGVLLSGGQRQRVALARALARKPKLLILDEATSALDSESERAIQESIQALHGTITVLIIAHRLTTVQDADIILVLDKGQIVEKGAPKQLLADQTSYFYRMQHTS